MNVYLDLENPGGSGFWVGGYMSQGREIGEQFTSNLGTRWTDPVTMRRVPSKLKGDRTGEQGEKKKEDVHVHIYPRLVYITECL